MVSSGSIRGDQRRAGRDVWREANASRRGHVARIVAYPGEGECG